jgi:ABC-2 type transport system permease protein
MATNVTTLTNARPSNASLKQFVLLVKADALMYLRNKTPMFWNIVFPIGLMLILGALYGGQQVNPDDPNSLTAISYIVPGLIVLGLMSNGLISNSTTMANYREKGILRRIQTTPLPVGNLVLARVMNQSFIMLVQSFLMVAVSMLVFNARYEPWGLVKAIPAIILGSIMFMAMGQAIAALVTKWETTLIVAQVVNFPLMFFGGLWIPIMMLPQWLQGIARLLPSAMVADLVRAPMLGDMVPIVNLPLAVDFIGVLVYFAVSVFIVVRFFRWS